MYVNAQTPAKAHAFYRGAYEQHQPTKSCLGLQRPLVPPQPAKRTGSRPSLLGPIPCNPSLLPGHVSPPPHPSCVCRSSAITRPHPRTPLASAGRRRGCSWPAAPSPLTPSPAVAAAATSGPQAPRRFAPGAPPPRTSARPPAKAAAVEAAAEVMAAPPPRPPEPPTRTSPNRGRSGFVTQAGQGGSGGLPRPLPRSPVPQRTPGPHVPARAATPRPPC